MQERRTTPRTHYIHRISYTTQERIVGIFVLLAVSILVGLLLSSGTTSNLFKEHIVLYGQLDSIQAINKDTEVSISGLSVGSVTSVSINDNNSIILTMSILKKYHNLLREDSTAKLGGLNLAVVQKTTIEITAGSAEKPLLEPGSTLIIKEGLSLDQLISKIEPVFLSLEDSLNKINRLVSIINPEQIRDTLEDSLYKTNQILSVVKPDLISNSLNSLHTITENIEDISSHIRAGEGIVGHSLYNRELNNSIVSTTKNMEQASAKINLLLEDIKQQIDHVPELLEKIGPLLNEADKTIKATQNIWPLSSAVEKNTNKETLIPPEPAND